MRRSGLLKRYVRLASTTPLTRRTPLRAVSERQRRINAERRPALAALLDAEPWCQARLPGCTGRSEDGHELLRRSQGGDATKPDRAVCRACHDRIGQNPTEAVELGLAVWGWQTMDGCAHE